MDDFKDRFQSARQQLFSNCSDDNLNSYLHKASKVSAELQTLRDLVLTDVYVMENLEKSGLQTPSEITTNQGGSSSNPGILPRQCSIRNSAFSKLTVDIPDDVLEKLDAWSDVKYFDDYLSIVKRFKTSVNDSGMDAAAQMSVFYWKENCEVFELLSNFLSNFGHRSVRSLDNDILNTCPALTKVLTDCCVAVEAKLTETLDAIVGFSGKDVSPSPPTTPGGPEGSGQKDQAHLEAQLVDQVLLWLHFTDNLPIPATSVILNHDASRFLTDSLVDKLIVPFQRRFQYHFTGDKKTNSVKKPEWMFSQVLLWIRDYRDLFSGRLQLLLKKFTDSKKLKYNPDKPGCLPVFDVWLQRLLKFVNARVEHNLEVVMDDMPVFSHLIDETAIFEAGLRGLVDHRSVASGCLDFIISKQEYLDLWLKLEHISNTERVNQLLCSKSAFLGRYQEASDIDEFKVPDCVDEFLILLQLITERYKFLHDPVAKQRFLSLQLALLDDFRVRLIQIGRDLETVWCVRYCQVLNSLVYITYVLREWNDLPFFVHLSAVKQGAKAFPATRRHSGVGAVTSSTGMAPVGAGLELVSTPGVFDGLIDLFDHLLYQMLHTLVDDVLIPQLKHDLVGYKKEKWYAITEVPTKITYSFCHFLLTLRDRLTFLAANLNASILRKCVGSLASSLNRYFISELINGIHFREFGGLQLCYDLEQGMFPLLTSFDEPGSSSTSSSSRNVVKSAFRELNDSVSVLSLPVGSAILLKETVSNVANDGGRAVMKEFDLADIDMDCLKVLLSQRIDIPVV